MTFGLKRGERAYGGIVRNIRSEVEEALEYLDDVGDARPNRAAEVDAVHEVRKSFKRIRAALRLLRESLGDDAYHDENFAFRDAARPLTQVRDAQILVETLDKHLPRSAFAGLRDVLVANEREVTQRVLHEGGAFSNARTFANGALRGLTTLREPPHREGWGLLEPGVRRVYRTGRHALAVARRSPTVENLHELRKQAKYMWHVLQLLEPTWTENDGRLVSRAHELSSALGDDHDLAVLRRTLAADPLKYGGHAQLKVLFAGLDVRREELQQHALATQLYADPPRAFVSRLKDGAKAVALPPSPQQ